MFAILFIEPIGLTGYLKALDQTTDRPGCPTRSPIEIPFVTLANATRNQSINRTHDL